MTLVSVIVKTLNEERHVSMAIESALRALKDVDGEIIVADSASNDRTVEIALRYPVRVVQLARRKDRGCGVGPQLGYQYSNGAYICLIDGDMVLDDAFIARGLDFLSRAPQVAGVGGVLNEMNVVSLEFVRRVKRSARNLSTGPIDRLNGGGLYRRSAIESVGYFSDRNLHAREEFELAARLRTAGWKLHKLDQPFVSHFGHTENAYRLLGRRLLNGYLRGSGEVLRAALGKPQFRLVVSELRELRLWLAIYASWVTIATCFLLAPDAWTAAMVALSLTTFPFALMGLRYRSPRLGVYAVVAWNFHALGSALGFLHGRIPPRNWIDSRLIENSPSESANAGSEPFRLRSSRKLELL